MPEVGWKECAGHSPSSFSSCCSLVHLGHPWGLAVGRCQGWGDVLQAGVPLLMFLLFKTLEGACMRWE